MNFSEIKQVYFLGVGGIGMSALARFFLSQGIIVYGYDKSQSTLTQLLEKEGVNIIYDDRLDSFYRQFRNLNPVKKSTLFIYTPAIPLNHPVFNYIKHNRFKLYKRAKVLGLISRWFYTIAVAGTHGKTTTSVLIAHLLKQSGIDVIALLGGISANYNSNYIAPKTQYPFLVTEADEFDRSFLHLFPDDAIITSVDPDHLDIYGSGSEMLQSYKKFSKCIKPGGSLLVNKKVAEKNIYTKKKWVYSMNDNSPVKAYNIRTERGVFCFDYRDTVGTIINLKLGIQGVHNIENAVAAISVCRRLGMDSESIRKGLKSYKGVKRRFEYIIRTGKHIFIDDYAHHPAELRAIIESVRMLYPKRKITGIFQPHLYSRTRDFADGFAESLDLLDEIILLEIYAAREIPIKNVNSEMIRMKMKNKNVQVMSFSETLKFIKKEKPALLLTLGAGDIDTLVAPIYNILK